MWPSVLLFLAACWVAITADVLKMLTIYGPHSMLFMQAAYNLPVLPIVLMQKKCEGSLALPVLVFPRV